MKFRLLSALAICLCLLTACQSGSSDSGYAFKTSSGGRWGVITPSGDVLFEGEFKEQPTDVLNGIFFARTGKDDMWQIYEASSKPATVSDDSFMEILPFKEDVTVAMNYKGEIVVVDKKGNIVGTLDRIGDNKIYYATSFNNGISIIGTSAGFGAINTKGEVIVKPKYCLLSEFCDGVALGIENKYKDETDDENIYLSFINSKGEVLFNIKGSKYSRFEPSFNDGLLAVCKQDGDEQRWGFINKKGEEVVKPSGKNAKIGEWTSSVYVFSDGRDNSTLWGLKKISNDEVLIRCKYDRLEFADKAGTLLWAGEVNSRGRWEWTLINRDGEVVSKETYKAALPFYGGYSPVQVSDNEWTFIGKNGEEKKLKTDIAAIGGVEFSNVIADERLLNNIRSSEDLLEILESMEELDEVEENEDEMSDEYEAGENDIYTEIIEEHFGDDFSGMYRNYYVGTIGGAPVHMIVIWNNVRNAGRLAFWGYYFYDKSVANGNLLPIRFDGTAGDGDCTWDEYDAYGNVTGTADIKEFGNTCTGTFTRSKDSKQFSIKLSEKGSYVR